MNNNDSDISVIMQKCSIISSRMNRVQYRLGKLFRELIQYIGDRIIQLVCMTLTLYLTVNHLQVFQVHKLRLSIVSLHAENFDTIHVCILLYLLSKKL